MTDSLNDGFRETGEVLTELVAKAKEARRAGATRRDFFANTAKLAGATALGAAGIKVLQPIAARAATAATPPSDTALDILNIAATAEALAITFYTHALLHTGSLHMVNNMDNKNYFQAAVSQEYAHLQVLESLGGKPLFKHFYFPTAMFTDQPTFFSTAITLEEYFIAAYTAAAVEFSGAYSTGLTTPNLTGIGLCVQIAGVEAEHRALLREASNVNPPNNLLFEEPLLTSVGGAVAPLTPFLASGASGFNTVSLPLPSVDVITSIAGPYPIGSFPNNGAFTIFSPA
jgi:hypothetical protein